MDKIRWVIFGVICVLVLGGLVLLANKDKQDVSNINPNSIIKSENGSIGDRVYGNETAKVVLYEYGDFQCPSCGAAYPQIKTIKEKYRDQIAFVFRNFPLTSIHPNALAASAAAEAAGQQGKFWEMHDALYENQNSWSSSSTDSRNDIFEQYAQAIGLNMDQYRSDLTSKAVTEKIARDRAIGGKIKVSSTPTFYVNDELVNSETNAGVVNGDGSALMKLIDQKLKEAGVEPPKSN